MKLRKSSLILKSDPAQMEPRKDGVRKKPGRQQRASRFTEAGARPGATECSRTRVDAGGQGLSLGCRDLCGLQGCPPRLLGFRLRASEAALLVQPSLGRGLGLPAGELKAASEPAGAPGRSKWPCTCDLNTPSSVTAAPSTLLCHLLEAPVTTNHGHQLLPNRKPRQAAFLVPHTHSLAPPGS